MNTIVYLKHDTPTKLFRQRCQQWSDKPALRRKRRGLWESVTWSDYYDRARAIGLQLHSMGLQPAAVICVLAENRPEWLYVDMGAQCMGFVGNGIYPTSSADQVLYILQDSCAQAVFVENQEQLEKVLAVRDRCPSLRAIVVMDGDGLRGFTDPQVSFFDDFLLEGMRRGKSNADEFERSIDQGCAEDIAFLVYTSGTTGSPKGAMILNRNVVFQLTQVHQYLNVEPGDKSLSFLPLCHIAERMSSVYNPLAVGLIVHFPENSGTVNNDLREVAPHVLFAPPRFWEKMFSQIELFLRDAIPLARWAYQHARKSGDARVDAKLRHEPVPPLDLFSQLVRWLALRNIRISLGLQNISCALTGAAPVPAELIRWFLICGIELREAYGMTETTGFCASTPKGGIKLGWAGVKSLGTEIRIGAENEIQIHGPNVFGGYWNMPEQTAEAVTADGWLRTGDCGELDDDGYLAIRDRIKDIIITSGGKNITPTHIESLLKFSPYITDVVAIGDGRNYLTCLVMLDQEHVARHAQECQIPYTDYASLARAPEVQALIRSEIERINPQLARAEQIKDFRILDSLLTAEDEELTPTMKLKRKVIARKYASLIDSMYRSSTDPVPV
ncbi:fatty-acid--CoA ligase [Polaromonas sp.]|nr:fatty-acid--CoA ligase [Polaromonas sp.]